MAQATKCVYDALACPPITRWLLMMRRFSSRTLTGMLRMEVAVGTPSDASMFAAILAAAPRRGVAPGASGGTGVGFAGWVAGMLGCWVAGGTSETLDPCNSATSF